MQNRRIKGRLVVNDHIIAVGVFECSDSEMKKCLFCGIDANPTFNIE
jgi:hypothetical protein